MGDGRRVTARGGPTCPWRSTRDPWAVLVSEVMAQQTQLARVVAGLPPVPRTVPRPRRPAPRAPLGDVLRAWQGLGYNRRARQPPRGRRGAWWPSTAAGCPTTSAALLALPGVGAYTARAVLAFAFEADVGVVDTNAGRVLSRAVAGRPVRPAEAQHLVDAMVPPGGGWAFGQALFDLGASVCRSGTPRCGECPVRRRCRWAARGRPSPIRLGARPGSPSPQSTFVGSDRQGRGRLVDRLRQGRRSARTVGGRGVARRP